MATEFALTVKSVLEFVLLSTMNKKRGGTIHIKLFSSGLNLTKIANWSSGLSYKDESVRSVYAQFRTRFLNHLLALNMPGIYIGAASRNKQNNEFRHLLWTLNLQLL